MKLNLAILAHRLADLDAQVCPQQNAEESLADVRLLKDQAQLSPDHLYLCTWENLACFPNISGLAFVVMGGGAAAGQYLEQSGASGLIIHGEADLFQVFEQIQDTFLFYNRLSDDLTKAILQDEPFVPLLNICARFFDSPVMLFDASLSLIAISTNVAIPETDRDFQETLSTGFSSVPLMSELKRRGLTSLLNASPVALFIDPGPGYAPFISANFFDQGERIASLSIVQTGVSLSAALLGLADAIVGLLAPKILKHFHSLTHQRILLKESIENLLGGKEIDPAWLSAKLGQYGWGIQDDYLLLRIVWPQHAVQNGTVEHSKNVYADLFPGCITLDISDTFVMVVHGKEVWSGNTRPLAALQELLATDDARCGASLPFRNFMVLREQFQMAGAALDFAKPGNCLAHYADIMHQHLFAELAKNWPLQSFCLSEVIKLHEQDRKPGGYNIQSLLVYLKHERSLKAAAKELHIHRNSLVYRLNQIEKATGLNFNDPQIRLHALLSCLLLQYLDQLKTG